MNRTKDFLIASLVIGALLFQTNVFATDTTQVEPMVEAEKAKEKVKEKAGQAKEKVKEKADQVEKKIHKKQQHKKHHHKKKHHHPKKGMEKKPQ